MPEDIFDSTGTNPDFWRNLTNFGFSAMANANKRDANGFLTYGNGVLGPLGAAGEETMKSARENALAKQQAQFQQAQTEKLGFENQLAPLNLELMKYKMNSLKQDMADDEGGLPSAGMTYSSSAGNVKPAQPQTVSRPSTTGNPTYLNIKPIVFKTANQTGVDPALLHGVFMNESSGNLSAPNGDGGAAVGGMQLHAGAAKDAGGGDRTDPMQNLKMGATYLKQQIDKYGDPITGILAYNWGPGNVDNWIKNGRDPAQIPAPQQAYVDKALKNATEVGYSGPQATSEVVAPAASMPQTAAEIQTLQGRIEAMSRKLRVKEGTGLPTKDLEINLKAAQDQLATAMKTQQEVEAAEPKKAAETKGAGTITDVEHKQTGGDQVSSVISELRQSYKDLDETGGAVNINNSAWQNVKAYAANTKGGQIAGKIMGTKEQSIRNNIAQRVPFLINAIRQATGMSAKAMDSNTELKFYLQAVTDPTLDVKANLEALDGIEKMYGSGKLGAIDGDDGALATYKTPEDIGQAYRDKKLSKQQAESLLQKQHGMD